MKAKNYNNALLYGILLVILFTVIIVFSITQFEAYAETNMYFSADKYTESDNLLNSDGSESDKTIQNFAYEVNWFNKGETRVQLTSVDVRDEYTASYSPVTYGHLCYYVNGMLSMPGGISGLFNIFEVDPDTMKINLEAMERDITQYGLYTYAEFAELVPVSEDVFNAFNGQYLKVAVGKGLITVEQLNSLAIRYAEFFV